MGYYEKTPHEHQAMLIDTELVNSIIHLFDQFNFTRGGIEVQLENVPFNLIGF